MVTQCGKQHLVSRPRHRPDCLVPMPFSIITVQLKMHLTTKISGGRQPLQPHQDPSYVRFIDLLACVATHEALSFSLILRWNALILSLIIAFKLIPIPAMFGLSSSHSDLSAISSASAFLAFGEMSP